MIFKVIHPGNTIGMLLYIFYDSYTFMFSSIFLHHFSDSYRICIGICAIVLYISLSVEMEIAQIDNGSMTIPKYGYQLSIDHGKYDDQGLAWQLSISLSPTGSYRYIQNQVHIKKYTKISCSSIAATASIGINLDSKVQINNNNQKLQKKTPNITRHMQKIPENVPEIPLDYHWLVVLTILKNMKVNRKDYPVYELENKSHV